MATLSYITNVSLDGFIEDAEGAFDWSDPDDELFAHMTELIRPVGTYLYGRRLYESMAVWETDPQLAAASPLTAEFSRLWVGADKVVHSTTLDTVATRATRVERRFDAEAIRELKAASPGDLTVGGAELAAQAFAAGLVDEVHLVVHPVLVGRGKLGFPGDARVKLDLVDERRFPNGAVHLHHRVTG